VNDVPETCNTCKGSGENPEYPRPPYLMKYACPRCGGTGWPEKEKSDGKDEEN
jgi:DnaJ-class molecular chaperone